MNTTVGLVVILFFLTLLQGGLHLSIATVAYGVVLVVGANYLRTSKTIRLPLLVPVTIGLLAFGITIFFSVNPAQSLLKWLNYFFAATMFYLAVNVLDTDKRLNFLIGSMVLLAWFEPALIVAQKIIKGPDYYLIDDAPGTFRNANVTAAFMLLWVPLFLDRWRSARSTGLKIGVYWASGFIAALLCVALCLSAWAVLVLIIFLPWRFWARIKKPVAFLLIGSSAAFIFKFGDVLLSRFAFRMGVWQSALNMFFDHPWTGVGVGCFSSSYLAYRVGDNISPFAHSFVFNTLAETGALGVLGVLLFVVIFLKQVRANWSVLKARWVILVSLAAFFSFNLIHFGFDVPVNVIAVAVLTGAFLSSLPTKQWELSFSRKMVLATLMGTAFICLSMFFISGYFYTRADEMLAQGNETKALQYLSKSTSFNPLSGWPHRSKAYIYSEKFKDVELAIASQGQAIRRDKLNPQLWLELSQYFRAVGRVQEAKEALENARHRGYFVYDEFP